MAKSPTEKALNLLKAYGFSPEVVEHWNSFAQIRQDLLGFADILAFNPRIGAPTLALQVTSEKGGVAARVKKILAEPRAMLALRCGWRIEVWGMRSKPVKGSGILARSFVLDDDGTVRVEEGSLAIEVAQT